MPDLQEQSIIVEHALLNEENLTTAIKLAQTFDAIRERIIIDFGRAVKVHVEKALGEGWSFQHNEPGRPLPQREQLALSKDSWDPRFRVVAAADSPSLSNVYFAVRGELVANSRISRDQVKAYVDSDFAPGQRQTSHWYRYVDRRFLHWNSEEGLVHLRRQVEAVPYFSDAMVGIARAIDRLLSETIVN